MIELLTTSHFLLPSLAIASYLLAGLVAGVGIAKLPPGSHRWLSVNEAIYKQPSLGWGMRLFYLGSALIVLTVLTGTIVRLATTPSSVDLPGVRLHELQAMAAVALVGGVTWFTAKQRRNQFVAKWWFALIALAALGSLGYVFAVAAVGL